MLEKIVLIFALFGSAKVALDMIATVFAKKKVAEIPTDQSEALKEIVGLLEDMSKKHDLLQMRLAVVEAERSAAELQQKTTRRTSKKTTPAAPVGVESISQAVVENLLQTEPSDGLGAHQFFANSDRFEVVIG